jgi:lysylphosphatidylglycerol synthetase-like protein (DUF2156 family)
MVVADLHLTREPGPAETIAAGEVASAISAATGPGVVVFNGNLFDAGAEPQAALAAHTRLAAHVAAYAAGAGRKVVVLPGDRDARLAWSQPCQAEISRQLGAQLALELELTIHTAAGPRAVRVEPGHNLDPLSRFTDPRNPRESPYAQHLRDELFPSMRRRQSGAGEASWLAGMEDLDSPESLSRFVASRLVYRRLGRSAWLLLLPVAAAIVLRAPTFALRSARHVDLTSRVGIAALATIVEVLLLAALAVAALRRTGRALSALSLNEARCDPNDAARAKARDLVMSGHSGFITGHTCRPELAQLGDGFYANAGCGTEVVTEYATRVPGLGLPAVFLGHRQLAWVELEAGNDLHLRLLHGRQDLPGATFAERLLASRPVSAKGGGELHAEVVASWPQGRDWPVVATPETRDRRVRRLASLAVFVVGFLSLLSSLAAPLRDRLDVLRELIPLAIPETAASLAALGGLGLMILARGIRRGQRRAWLVCEGLLIAVAILHVVKGVDVEESLIALGAGAFLWVYRSSFEAKTDVEQVGRGLAGVIAASMLTVLAGSLALELSSWVQGSKRFPRLSWGRALEASLQRMVGLSGVALPPRLDEFFSPAMATAAAGLLAALLFVVFRPVVLRQLQHQATKGSPGDDADPVAAASRGGDLARARAVVARHGKGTLDYFALRPDKQFFFWGETVVAYAVYGSVCLVSPDPIGPVAERTDAWKAFRRYVDEHGWALGGLGAGEEWLPIYRESGMHDLYVGDEAIVRVGRFSLEGGRFKGLRQAVNRIAKYGYTISFHDGATLEPALRCALEEVMTKSRRGDVERGFSMTLGRACDPEDRDLLLAVVHGPDGTPVAFCQYVPAPGIDGYSLDLMRRDDGDHPNGLIDFAVVETIKELRRRGLDGLGLNFATMRAVLAGEAGEGVTQRVQGWMLRRMGDSMQIESLWKFNAKFDPDWQPRYALYDAPENMLAVAIAVARAESFWELPVIGRFLVPPAPVG